MKNPRPYVIYAPSYNEDSGGIIVLHKLCHLLNEMGQRCFFWPNPHGTKVTTFKRARAVLRRKPFHTLVNHIAPLAKKHDLEEAIVIYPETDDGNPLNSSRVVRWLLHKPGFHTGRVNYTANELMFVFDDYCIEAGFNMDPQNKLFVLSLNDAYHDRDCGVRKGVCYMMRKGRGRTLVHEAAGSICLDGLSHSEISEVFRRCTHFYCYDEFTLYSQYAALCGCISIVIPEKFSSRDHWVEKHPISRYGIAYGLDDLEHAISTRHKVREYFDQLEMESKATICRFVDVSQAYFR